MTRNEYGRTCPLGFTGNKRQHDWIEITLPHHTARRFLCDNCTATATDALTKEGIEK